MTHPPRIARDVPKGQRKPDHVPLEEALEQEATAIIEMAQDLQARGLHAEAIAFACAAAQRLQAVRALQRIRDASAPH
jgi:hypothetical protein